MLSTTFLLTVLSGASAIASPFGFGDLSNPSTVYDESRALHSGFIATNSNDDGVIALGDMLFTTESYLNWVSAGRSYLMKPYNQWPKDTAGYPVISYVIDKSISSTEQQVLMAGMNQWNNTCVRFVNRNLTMVANYLNITKSSNPDACTSYVGNIFSGAQPLTMGSRCFDARVAAHELGHAMGLGHEHNRADRDSFLTLFTNNIAANLASNFEKESAYYGSLSVPYNYLSVMHYFWSAFSVNANLPTMLPQDPTLQVYTMQTNGVSHYDNLLVNRAFNCSGLWSRSCVNPPDCMNHGYLAKNCQCVCPLGTSGTRCETLTASSLPAYPTNFTNFQCGGIITAAATDITTPLFGASSPARESQADCFWWIKKPSTASTAKVTFTAFSMYNKQQDGSCYYEFLEVRTSSLYLADSRKCGNDYGVNSVISSSGDIVLWFQSRVYPGGNTGFKFNVSFA